MKQCRIKKDELEASKDEVARDEKRVALFQSERKLLQWVEKRLREEMAALRQRNVQLESERNATSTMLDAQAELQNQMESRIETITVYREDGR